MAEATIGTIATAIKHCSGCNRDLPVDCFNSNRRLKDGRNNRCKECVSAYGKLRRKSWTPERRRAENKRINRKRDEAIAVRRALPQPPKTAPATKRCSRCKQDFPRTLEFFSPCTKRGFSSRCKKCSAAYRRERRNQDPEKYRAMDRALTAANPDKAKARVKKYHTSEKGIQARKRAQRTRYEKHWLADRMASRIRNIVGGKSGASRWPAFLQYGPDALRAHIERQFTKGMTWEKFQDGLIHIDHILAVTTFDIAGPQCPELVACFALSNLRPMWAPDNLKKGAKRLYLL